PHVVDILSTCLREEGYGVLGALMVDEGLKDFILSCPDLILLDIALPGGMDGIELLKTHSFDQSDEQGDHGDREYRSGAGPRVPRAWRARVHRQAVRFCLPQAGCRHGAPAPA